MYATSFEGNKAGCETFVAKGELNRLKNQWWGAHKRAWVWICSLKEGRVRGTGGWEQTTRHPNILEEKRARDN